jgi:hypothetical protein
MGEVTHGARMVWPSSVNTAWGARQGALAPRLPRQGASHRNSSRGELAQGPHAIGTIVGARAGPRPTRSRRFGLDLAMRCVDKTDGRKRIDDVSD